MFEKVLVPLDGSEHSLRALDIAIQIAKKFKASITLAHVFSVTATPMIMPEPTTLTPSGIPTVTPAEISKIVEATREVGNRILSDGKDKVKSAKVEVDTVLREGNTVQEIVKIAKEGKFGLIVIGVRGVSKIRELLVGSVSDGVMKHAPCPVLVVK